MANLPPYPDTKGNTNRDTRGDTRVRPDRASSTGTPRWVMIVGIIILVLVLLYAIMMLAGVGGEHGPGRHTPSGSGPGAGSQTSPFSVAEGAHTPSGSLGGHTPPSAGHANTDGGGPIAADKAAKVALDTGGAVVPGVETALRFNLTDASSGSPVNPVVAHEKEMHLIVVSRDLNYFAHVHPERTGQVGEYQIKHTFPKAGDYVLYDEFELAGKSDEYHRFDLKVGGSGSPSAQLTQDLSPKQVGDYTARIVGGPVKAGDPSGFVVTIEQNGKPVTDLEPYLGAASHVVVLDESAGGFAHVHAVAGDTPHAGDMKEMSAPPARFGPDLSFSHNFDKPGFYKVWSQFSHNGQVQTVSWVVEAR